MRFAFTPKTSLPILEFRMRRANQYKVLQSFYPMVDPERCSIDYLEVEIYTIGTGVWRSIGNAPSDFLKFPLSALLPGALHWVSLTVESAECIHSFSFETEQFRSLPLPSNYGRVKREFHDLLKLGVLGGYLVLCVFGGGASRELDMWVMMKD
ncbi:F-box protein [Prunus yedoensis var. nudiflora]|uniref:F-box protein n=1 Tax=Prunus yedoensis var. nudiflora TaxID=2094558 RepID=A0A314Y616_PRUYE|nr:F-box protein [Prunus yedoensis var. nudiflora]PQP99920.1 F-box protein [Prunus yedoensis var. nudiflora]